MTTDISPLSIHQLSAHYPGQKNKAIDSIDWDCPQGQLCAIIGPNGAGKSTLLKAVMDLIPHKAGHVEFFGKTLDQSRKRIAYVPQRSAVDWDFPVSVLDVATMGLYGNIGLFSSIKQAHKDKAMQALEQVGMQKLAQRQIGALSGGQQQRTFLARALVQEADLYLMDEPFAGVDVPTEQKIIEILNSLKQQGKTIIVVHHDLGTVERVFDHALLLNTRAIAQGPIKDVMTKEHLTKAYGSTFSILNNTSHG